MDISVVIPTHDQRERLRLVLCGLLQQSFAADRFEVLVVDDGCSDGTWDALQDTPLENLRWIRRMPNVGRNRARNLGIAEARGQLIVFLDGDALPEPDMLTHYWRAFEVWGDQTVFCGLQYCLPELEYLADPQRGVLMDRVMPSVLKDYIAANKNKMVVTQDMVRDDFNAIQLMAKEGGYPVAGSKERQEEVLELFAMVEAPECAWLGFIPHNGAISRCLLDAHGGFDEKISFFEGWELAYRLQRCAGASVRPVNAASYHLYHYHPFKDPQAGQEETQVRFCAIEHMVDKHGDERLRLLYLWFAHLWPDSWIPAEAVVPDLVEFERRYREAPAALWDEYRVVLENHPFLNIPWNYGIEVEYETSAK